MAPKKCEGIKDPTVPGSVRVVRGLFSTTTASLVTSAVVIQLARPSLARFLARVTGRSVDGRVGGAVVLVGAATLGLGAGVGWTSALQWLRWKLIQRLLAYKGWLFDQRSTRTKVSRLRSVGKYRTITSSTLATA